MNNELLSKIHWQFQNLYCKGIHAINKVRQYSPKDCVIICGSGRSGTTWLAEIIGALDHATILDEPLKRPDSKRVQRIGFSGSAQYIPQGNYDWPEAKAFFDDLLSGQEFNPNHLHGKWSGLLTTNLWVLKFIRAHLLLPWLIDTYPVRKPVYLIRNPYAVVASQLKHAAWNHNQVAYKKPSTRYNAYFDQFEPIYSTIKNNVQFKAFNWALENSFLLNHDYHNKEWLTVHYERLFKNPEAELEILFQELGLIMNDRARESIRKKSYSTSTDISRAEMQTQKWKTELRPSEISDISEILRKFNLNQFLS